MADWVGFNENLNKGVNSFLQNEVAKRKQQQDLQMALQFMMLEGQMKQENAIQQVVAEAMIKAQIEQQDPYKQAMTQAMQSYFGGGGGGGGGMGGAIPPGRSFPTAQQVFPMVPQNLQQRFAQRPVSPPSLANRYRQMNPAQPQQGGFMGQRDMVPEFSFGPSGPSIKFSQSPEAQIRQKVAEKRATTLAEGIPNSEIGKATLAREAIRNIKDVKNILFPKGTAQSYKRNIATASNLPLSGLPGIPSNFGTYNPQTIFRKMGAALSGRQLIQTGVAARPEETAKLVRQFAPSGLMSSQAALDGLSELEKFYTEYLNLLQTKGIEVADSWAQGQNKNQAQGTTQNTNKKFSGLWE